MHTKSVRILNFIVIIAQVIVIWDLIAICVFSRLMYDAINKSWSDTININ